MGPEKLALQYLPQNEATFCNKVNSLFLIRLTAWVVSFQEGVMDLRECKFYCSGREMNFAVFSDDACRACYLQSIPLPIIQGQVDVYEIEPGRNTHWILIKQRDGEKNKMKLFVRQGNRFVEDRLRHLSKEMRGKIFHRFPKLRFELGSAVLA